MIWPGLLKLGKELQFKRTETELVGMVKNCYIKMYDGQNMKVVELFAPEITDSDKDYVINRLQESKVKKHEWLEYGVKIIFNEYIRPYPIQKIRDVIADISDYFSENCPDQKLHCQKCGTPNDLDTLCYGNVSMAVCEDCERISESEIDNLNTENKYAPDNYVSGFIGSLIFSIPGIFVTIMFFVFLNTLAAISSVLYVFLGIKGYKKFNGKTSRFGAFLIILSTIIMVGLGIIIAYSVFILKEIGTFDLDLLVYILKVPEVQQEILHNIAISYVVSGIYLVFQLIKMMREWKTEITIKKPQEL